MVTEKKKKKDTHVFHLLTAQDTEAPKATQTSSEERVPLPRQRHKLDHYAIIKFPLLSTEQATKKTEDNNTLAFTVVVKASKDQIKQAVKKL